MRIANVENNALNWVSISTAGALDMMHCDFSVRSARDEMRHIIGSSKPDVIIGSAACGRYFVHELTSEVNSRLKFVTKMVAMPGTRTIVTDLCILEWPRAMKEDQESSKQVYGRSPTRDKLECGCKVNA